MDENRLLKLEKSVENLKNKSARIYFFVQDTKGNAKAGVRYIYQMALALRNNGYNSIILHEKADYVGVAEWLGEEYMKIPHKPIEGQNLEISPEDFLLIPEIFGFIMEQVKDLPCAKIVICQAYDHMMETLQPGFGWANYGFLKCITTSEFQKEYISSVMKNVTFDILEPVISDEFEKTKFTQQPIVSVHSRDPRKTVNLIKTFYLKYPQYRWITFRDLRGLNQTQFAQNLQSSFLSVWVDETSGYGTFPLESMKCGVPCVGKIPSLFPDWMNEDNGIWLMEETKITDYVAEFIQNWLEDNIKPELYTEMDKTVSNLIDESKFEESTLNLFISYFGTRLNSFEEQLNKLKPEETNSEVNS
jgi:hypothetical protein